MVGGINSKQIIEFFRILRVAVVRLPGAAPSAHVHHMLPVIYRSFAPQLLTVAVDDDVTTGSGSTSSCTGRRRRRPESMKETFTRAIVELMNIDEMFARAIMELMNIGESRRPNTEL